MPVSIRSRSMDLSKAHSLAMQLRDVEHPQRRAQKKAKERARKLARRGPRCSVCGFKLDPPCRPGVDCPCVIMQGERGEFV